MLSLIWLLGSCLPPSLIFCDFLVIKSLIHYVVCYTFVCSLCVPLTSMILFSHHVFFFFFLHIIISGRYETCLGQWTGSQSGHVPVPSRGFEGSPDSTRVLAHFPLSDKIGSFSLSPRMKRHMGQAYGS